MTTVLQALREGTCAQHEAIERALDWQVRAADPEAYRAWIERLYGFHRVWEPAVAAAVADPGFTLPRRRLHLLAGDLEELGLPAARHAALPLPPFPVRFADAAAALGSMYVLEGSTLGGQLIARHVTATLGVRPRYHGGYGRHTGAMWRAFQAKLADAVAPEQATLAVAAATDTFRRLRTWLAGRDDPASAGA